MLTPEQRQLRASAAAHARWAQENPIANAVRGQRGLYAKFIREAFDANPGITDAEAERRADHAYQSHMKSLALASSRARKARKAGDGNAA